MLSNKLSNYFTSGVRNRGRSYFQNGEVDILSIDEDGHVRAGADALAVALSDTRVGLLQGARQTGKSTLVRWLVEQGRKAAYFRLEDASVLAAAAADPDAFVQANSGPVVTLRLSLKSRQKTASTCKQRRCSL